MVKKPDVTPTNIPAVRTSFIGRRQEVEEVGRLVGSSRLVTLTGAAGCGKTRLALRLAREVRGRYEDGVYWIELAPLAEAELIPRTVSRVLHVAEQPDRPSLETLLDALQERQLLLLLDNCEHLLKGCAQLAESLLEGSEASILATSREPLSVRGERLYPVAPLSLPPATVSVGDVAGVGHFDAVRLFVDRTRAILPAFELTADNAGVVTSICRKLDGIPLAIELASARVNVLTLEQIASRLDHRFELLAPAGHVSHSHHATLRAAIEWSHDLLSEPEQTLLRRLSVFVGGCSLTTAETVCGGDGIEREQVLDLLSSLVDKSLVVAQTLQPGEARYSFLETIRQYAREKLKASGEWSAMRDRHLHCFLQLAEETEPKLKGEYQQLWLEWLEGEYDNIRAGLSWSLEGGPARVDEQVEKGLRIAIALYQFWTIRDYVEEGLAWLQRLLKQADEGIPAVVRANALAYAAFLAGFRGNVAAQMTYGEEAAALAEGLGDEGKQVLVWALAAKGFSARAAGDYETEFAISQRVIELHRESGDMYLLGLALTLYTVPAMALGRFEVARGMLDEGLPLLREIGDPYRIAMALNYSGDLARCQGDYVRARTAYEESLSLLSEIEAVRDRASVLHNLGHSCLRLGEEGRAQALFGESMDLHQQQGNRPGMAECLIGFAALAIFSDLPAAGARLLGAAEAAAGQHVTSEWAATGLEYDRYLARARDALTEKAFQAEQAAGQRLTLEEAVADARDVVQEAVAAEEARKKVDELTPREREVAALIAQAMSNAEIAEELVISKRTVETHISNIRSKLAFTKRAQIVRWAIENGLVNASE